uniref:Uncharacterized protein n=1 Tax=Cucumis melo TaxID=3656 RepID=A0A9I9E178_CUCME
MRSFLGFSLFQSVRGNFVLDIHTFASCYEEKNCLF